MSKEANYPNDSIEVVEDQLTDWLMEREPAVAITFIETYDATHSHGSTLRVPMRLVPRLIKQLQAALEKAKKQ
jgi:hypothetical protein